MFGPGLWWWLPGGVKAHYMVDGRKNGMFYFACGGRSKLVGSQAPSDRDSWTHCKRCQHAVDHGLARPRRHGRQKERTA